MTPVSKVVDLFDGVNVAPGAGHDLFVGGDYPEQQAGASDRTVYYPGGSARLGDLNEAGGPQGLADQMGGGRKNHRKSRRRQNRKSKRRSRRSSTRSRRSRKYHECSRRCNH